MELGFEIQGKPKSMARVRFDSKKRVTFTDRATQKEKLRVRELAMEMMGIRSPVKDIVSVDCYFYFQRAKGNRKGNGASWRMSTPDVDNLGKLILDAMNGVVYEDDRQVCSLNLIKLNHDHPSKTVVEIKTGNYVEPLW